MASEEVLRKTLKNADGKPFLKYKGLTNNFVLEEFEIIFDDVQNDKTGHTRVRVRVPTKIAGFPDDTHDTKAREIALRDLIARRFWESARTHARSPLPKMTGGEVFIPRPGQEILERGSIVITQYYIEARFTADLPADSGKVTASGTETLIFERIGNIVKESLRYSSYKQSKVYNHIQTYENAEHIRNGLKEKGLVAFVAEGSILPRRDDDLAPMTDAVPFACDDSLKVSFDLPDGGKISGMGIPKGFTVLTGPSRSGKSTILDAVFAGVYNHIPGDGREYVVSLPDASFVMSEQGRPADSVDISMFMAESDEFEDTKLSKKDSVSASVSELISVSEAVEMGSELIMLDEGYSNPSVIRRGFLSQKDSITPLSEMGHSMGESGVSVLVVSGDESAIRSADNVIIIQDHKASKAVVDGVPGNAVYTKPADRSPISKGMVFEKGRKEVSVLARSIRCIEIGEFEVNVPVAALFDISQTRTVADAIAVMKDMMDGSKSMLETCRAAIQKLSEDDSAPEGGNGMYHVSVRPIDIAAVVNRHPQMLGIQKS